MQKTLNLLLMTLTLISYHAGYAMMTPHTHHDPQSYSNVTYVVHRRFNAPSQTPQQQLSTPPLKRAERPELILQEALDLDPNDPDSNPKIDRAKVIKHIEETHGDHYIAQALDQAIEAGNIHRVHTLFSFATKLQTMLVPRDGSMPALTKALRSFSQDDDAATTAQRFTILEILVNCLDPQHVPAAFEVDLCHGKDTHHIPEHIRLRIAVILNRKHVPVRICMNDQRREHDPNIGIADADLSEEERNKRHWFPASPLHQAALTGDYKRCSALLTTFQEPVLQNEAFPMEALKITQTPREQVADKQYQEATAIMAKFNATMNLKLDRQFTHSHHLRTAKDHTGRTAYDLAREANASAEIMQLLNPNDNKAIKLILAEKLNAIFMGNFARAQAEAQAQKAQAQRAQQCAQAQQDQAVRAQLQKTYEQFANKQLKVGDKVIIDGLEYTVTDAQHSK